MTPADLVVYPTADLAAAVRPAVLAARRGLLDPAAVEAVARALVLREETDAGAWWALGCCSGRWYRPGPGGWEPVDDGPAGLLLGPEPVPAGLELPLREAELPAADPADPQLDAAAGLAAHAARIRARFAAGLLGIADLIPLLGALILVDRDGGVHAPGWCSGRWYRWTDTAWRPAADPPPAAGLASPRVEELRFCPHCGTALAEPAATCAACGGELSPRLLGFTAEAQTRFEDFLAAYDGQPPEAVDPAWDPPPGVPEWPALPLRTCPDCGRPFLLALGGCPACRGARPVAAPGPGLAPGAPGTCPACGSPLAPAARFCTGCGRERADQNSSTP